MGIREDQFMGLPEVALAFLKKNKAPLEVCPRCGQQTLPPELEIIGDYWGMFDNKYPLHRHVLKDGRTADEFLQVAPCFSGPMHFLGLRVSDGSAFLWSSQEIEELSS